MMREAYARAWQTRQRMAQPGFRSVTPGLPQTRSIEPQFPVNPTQPVATPDYTLPYQQAKRRLIPATPIQPQFPVNPIQPRYRSVTPPLPQGVRPTQPVAWPNYTFPYQQAKRRLNMGGRNYAI